MTEPEEYHLIESCKFHFYTQQLVVHGLAALAAGGLFLYKGAEIQYLWGYSQDIFAVVLFGVGIGMLYMAIVLGIFSCSRFTVLVFDSGALPAIVLLTVYIALFVIELIVGVKCFLNIEAQQSQVLGRMKADFELQRVVGNDRMNEYTMLQEMLKCCGIDSYKDYKPVDRLPMSCCGTDISCDRGFNTYPGCRIAAKSEVSAIYTLTGAIYIVLALADFVSLVFIFIIIFYVMKRRDTLNDD